MMECSAPVARTTCTVTLRLMVASATTKPFSNVKGRSPAVCGAGWAAHGVTNSMAMASNKIGFSILDTLYIVSTDKNQNFSAYYRSRRTFARISSPVTFRKLSFLLLITLLGSTFSVASASPSAVNVHLVTDEADAVLAI